MATMVTLKNESTKSIKQVKIGWSWTLFLFSAIWGTPWFVRKIYDMGCVGAVLMLLYLGSLPSGTMEALGTGSLAAYDNIMSHNITRSPLLIISLLAVVIFSVFGGLKGNEITVKRYLKKGYNFVDPDSDDVRNIKRKWQL